MADRPAQHAPEENESKWLPAIGVEHVIVGLILLGAGIVLLFNVHASLGHDIRRLARTLGVDPSSNGVHGLLGSAKKLTSSKLRFYGIVAIAYGALEGTEGYGLIRRRRWGEYLTVVATLILFIPDIYELVKKPSIVKGALFALNVVMIVYLTVHLHRTGENKPEAAG